MGKSCSTYGSVVHSGVISMWRLRKSHDQAQKAAPPASANASLVRRTQEKLCVPGVEIILDGQARYTVALIVDEKPKPHDSLVRGTQEKLCVPGVEIILDGQARYTVALIVDEKPKPHD